MTDQPTPQATVTGPAQITIQIDLNELTERFWGDDPDYEGPTAATVHQQVLDQIVARVAKQLTGEVRQQVNDSITAHINTVVDELIRQVVVDGIKETNRYGQETGKVFTLQEQIADETKNWFSKVNDRYSGGRTRFDEFLREHVGLALQKELKPVVEQAKADVLQRISDEAGKIFQETIKRAAGIR